MSTDICEIKNTGSRNVSMGVTRYWGGDKGVCVQLTANTEDGGIGYVQLSTQDIITLLPILKREIIDAEAERINKEADEIIRENEELKKTLVSDIKDVSKMLMNFEAFEIGSLLLFGKQEVES